MKKIFLLFVASYLFGAAISIYNGQTLLIPFKKSYEVNLSHTTLKSWLIIPIPYTMKPATKKLKIDGKTISLTIKQKKYPKEQLEVASSKVHPPKSLLKRIAKEYQEAKKIYSTTSQQSYITKPFILPLQSKITDPFGVARVFNNRLKSYHSGTDFRARVGTPVKAINDGVVVLAKKRYYAGGSVIINHGRGIYSCYYHLSRFKVKPGERVKRGQIIALSGKSGRITGPHLHLTIKIKGISVDPMQFIYLMNASLKD